MVLFLALTFIPLLVGALIIIFTYSRYFRELISEDRKNRPPIAGTDLNLLIHFKRIFDYHALLAREYPTFRLISPSNILVFTADPTNIEHILKNNFPNYGKGEQIYAIMGDLLGDGIFAVDGDKWRHQRKLASHEFSTKVLRDFSSSIFRDNGAKFVSKVVESSSAKQVMDLQDLFLKSTLDSIFKVGFGVELNSLSGSDDFSNQFMKAFDTASSLTSWRFIDLLWKTKRFLNIGSEATIKSNIKIIDKFIYAMINQKRKQMKNGLLEGVKEDILSRFMIESEKDPENITNKYLRDITLSFVIAGRDTSANTLAWFFYMLCKHPFIQEKIAQEIREAIEAEHSPHKILVSKDEFSKRLSEAAVDRMQYLHAALTETLRLYPAVPADGKCAEKDDILPDGFSIKRGDIITYLPYAMGRMTYIWGHDAEEFKPERWLENGIFCAQSPYKFTAFQAGPRICLGKDFAYRQMKIMASFLLFFFKFKLADDTYEATYRTMLTLHMDKGLPVLASLRT